MLGTLLGETKFILVYTFTKKVDAQRSQVVMFYSMVGMFYSMVDGDVLQYGLYLTVTAFYWNNRDYRL
jgi:hypothetical protein